MRSPHASLLVLPFVLLPALLGSACQSPEVGLRVRLRSDLLPGLTVGRVEVELPELPEERRRSHQGWQAVDPQAAAALLDGLLVVRDERGLPPSAERRLRVRAYDLAERATIEREVIVDNRASIEVTVALTANCREMRCDTGFCLDSSCVDAACLDGSQPSCPPELACVEGSACGVGPSCAPGRCAGGVCLYEGDDGLCAPGERCDVTAGCRPEPLLDLDLDGDGLPDLYDPDDDGDGLSDLEECFAGLAQGEVRNGSFEEPVASTPEPPGVQYFLSAEVPGWSTTEGSLEYHVGALIGLPSPLGEQYIEMCTNLSEGVISQEIDSLPGSRLRWALLYRQRNPEGEELEVALGSSPEAMEVVEHLIAPPDWSLFTGLYTVPEGQGRTRLELRYHSTTLREGNLLDGVVLEPVCELDSDGDGRVDSRDPD